MIEIILIVALSRKLAAKLREKGRSEAGYVTLFVLLWIGGEIVGALLGALLLIFQDRHAIHDGMDFYVYMCALAGAAMGATIGWVIASSLPPVERSHWREHDDYDDDFDDDYRREDRGPKDEAVEDRSRRRYGREREDFRERED